MILNKAIFPLIITLITLCGCTTTHPHQKSLSPQTRNMMIGTAMGAAAGGVVGGFVHQPLTGALVGGGLGAIAGYSHTQERVLKKYDVDILSLNNQIILLLPSDKLFETNTANVKPESHNILYAVAKFLNQYPEQNIHVSANTSPVNSHLKFQKSPLSLQQAETVAGFLWARGIRQGSIPRRLTYSGNDDHYPIATNRKLAGMMKNRRIQITIYANTMHPYPQSTPVKTKKYEW